MTGALRLRLVIPSGFGLDIQVFPIHEHQPTRPFRFALQSHLVDLQDSSLRLLQFDFSLEPPPEVIPLAPSRPGNVKGIDEGEGERSVLLQQAFQLSKQIEACRSVEYW